MANEPTPRSKRSFSLRALLVVALIVALAIIAWNSSRQLDEAHQELQSAQEQLRQVTGELHVEDETKLYALAVDTGQPNTWRWRLFVPKGSRYMWSLAYQNIPPDGAVPERPQWEGVSNEPYESTANEVVVTAKLRERDDGAWQLSVESEIAGAKHQMGGASMKIPADELKWLNATPSTESFVLGDRETAILDPKGPILLLSRRPWEQLANGNYQPVDGPAAGFAIWLTPW